VEFLLLFQLLILCHFTLSTTARKFAFSNRFNVAEAQSGILSNAIVPVFSLYVIKLAELTLVLKAFVMTEITFGLSYILLLCSSRLTSQDILSFQHLNLRASWSFVCAFSGKFKLDSKKCLGCARVCSLEASW
jgi:hypothetical protein